MFKFVSEPGIEINGVEFKVRVLTSATDGCTYSTAWGREESSCAWFFVPPAEQQRLTAAGAVFRIEDSRAATV